MPATTPLGIHYPISTDAPNEALGMSTMATDIDTLITALQAKPMAHWLFCNTVTTDTSGYVTITHGAGFTPTVAFATPSSPITSGATASIFGFALCDTFTSTTVRVRCLFANGVQIATATVSFSLLVGQ
jgi:hypothetical protein